MIVHGHINQTPVRVVLDSSGTRFDDSSRLVRARRMREHAREHGQYAVSDGFMIRVSRQRGLSLAAQLEGLLPKHSGLVFIALSRQQVYLALLHQGLVYTEEIRSREEAEKALQAESGQAIVVETAERSGFAEACSGKELALSTAPAWHYQPMWRALLRQGLPHPAHLLGLLAPLLLLALGLTVQQYRAQWTSNNEAIEQQFAALRAATTQRQHPADARRQILFWAAYLHGLKAYRAQGLEAVTWNGKTVTLKGGLAQAGIHRLQAIARGRGEKLRLHTNGWGVEHELTTPGQGSGPQHEPIDLADWLARSEPRLRLADAHLELGKSSAGSGYTRYQLKLKMPRGTAPVFSLLAELLDAIPSSVESINIHYERALPMAATLELTLWGI